MYVHTCCYSLNDGYSVCTCVVVVVVGYDCVDVGLVAEMECGVIIV